LRAPIEVWAIPTPWTGRATSTPLASVLTPAESRSQVDVLVTVGVGRGEALRGAERDDPAGRRDSAERDGFPSFDADDDRAMVPPREETEAISWPRVNTMVAPLRETCGLTTSAPGPTSASRLFASSTAWMPSDAA